MENNITCYYCPLKWNCALWLFGKWDLNKEMCNCTDERLIALDNPFDVDHDLLNKWNNQVTKEETESAAALA